MQPTSVEPWAKTGLIRVEYQLLGRVIPGQRDGDDDSEFQLTPKSLFCDHTLLHLLPFKLSSHLNLLLGQLKNGKYEFPNPPIDIP